MQPISQLLSDDFAFQTFANSRPENAESTPSIPSSQGLRVRKGKMSGVDFANMKAKEAQARLANPSYEQAVLELILPDWNELYRGVPNGFLRSGLFTARSKSIRNDIRGIKIASLSNFDIFYKGQELSQDDLSVWIALMTRARKQLLDAPIYFTGYELVKDLGWRMHSD